MNDDFENLAKTISYRVVEIDGDRIVIPNHVSGSDADLQRALTAHKQKTQNHANQQHKS